MAWLFFVTKKCHARPAWAGLVQFGAMISQNVMLRDVFGLAKTS
jgi:hypothetical protein